MNLPMAPTPTAETHLELHDIPKLQEEVRALAKQRDAVILAHNYQLPEVQDVADYVGDSLGLSRQAAKTPAEVIIFAGVHFMAETAAILSPAKRVLLPDLKAGCSLAATVTAETPAGAWRTDNQLLVARLITQAARRRRESRGGHRRLDYPPAAFKRETA